MSSFYQALSDELCAGHEARCSTLWFAERHNHMSVVFSPGPDDTSVAGPILEWMQGIE